MAAQTSDVKKNTNTNSSAWIFPFSLVIASDILFTTLARE
jgi:hypothetical protein